MQAKLQTTRAGRVVHWLLIATAWLAVCASLVQIGFISYSGWFQDRGGAVSRVLSIEGEFDAMGQTYHGHHGTWLATVQVALVMISWILAHLRRPSALRLLGIIGVMMWALLWLGNSLVGLVVAPSEPLVWVHLAFVLPAACACFYYCGVCYWRNNKRSIS